MSRSGQLLYPSEKGPCLTNYGMEKPGPWFDPDGLFGVWHWTIGGKSYWLTQSNCMIGTGSVAFGTVALASEGKHGWVFLQDTLAEPEENKKRISYQLGIHDGTPFMADVVMDRYLLIASRNSNALIYDLISSKPVSFIKNLSDGGIIERLSLSPDAKRLIQINKDGRLFIYDLKTTRQILSGYYLDDELVLFQSDGYYDATPEGAHFVYLKFPGMSGYHSFAQFKKTLYRPEVIKNIIDGNSANPSQPNLTMPPDIELTLAAGTIKEEVSLEATARSTSGLKTIAIYIDGRLATSIPVSGKLARTKRTLPIFSETRWISAVATDIDGYESVPQTIQRPANSTSPRGRLFAVAVGTDNYDDSEINALDYARADARTFTKAVEASKGRYYRDVITTTMLDEDDLKSAIFSKVNELIAQAEESDTIMLHIAGHGLRDKAGQFYLATKTTRFAALKQTALPWSALAKILGQAKSKVVVFLDACHSGAAGTQATNDDAVADLINQNKGILVIAASKGRQYSEERSELNGGVFTTTLARLLGDKRASTDGNHNGVLELSEIYGALKKQVVEITNGKQTPWIARNGMVGEVPLF